METCKKTVLLVYYGVLMFLSFQVSHVYSSTKTIISTNQPLPRFDTLVSSGDIFELGIFNPTPGIYGNFYIGMWYRQSSPRTVVWVANRESPARGIDSHNCFLNISNGNLILHNNIYNGAIWSTGVNSSKGKDVQAVLLDNGNLVLRDVSSSSAAVLWQSFDHPSDTWLPVAKLKLRDQRLTSWKGLTDPSPGRYSLEFDHRSNSLITVWNRSKSYWSSGPWDPRLRAFKNFPDTVSFKLNVDESYITYSVVDYPDSIARLVIDVSGQLGLHIWNADIQVWETTWSQPENKCEVYNYCGSFGICNENQKEMPCRCVPGFERVVRQGWDDVNDFSGGCKRETKLQCGKGNDKFVPIKNIKLASDPITLILTSSLVTTCASACLANCSCQAYALDNNKCLMWTRNAFNLQQLDANEGNTFFLRLASSNISPKASNISPPLSNISTTTSNQGKTEHSEGISLVLPIVLSLLVAAGAALLVGLYCYISSTRRRKGTQTEEKQSRELLEGGLIDDDGENMCYLNLHDIMAATNSFSEEKKLGEGGFGPVYKGKLANGMDVAIKRLSKKSSQGMKEFKNEVVLIIKLQHKNLVRLLGYCVEGDEKLLIYEYMSNKSLDILLFGNWIGRPV
ncbi:G-type lectin S-receptor-like serine/threonine-protein kinase At4g11900 isoform X2 [Capsella rubella]|uniref:G-type lectin S-receptor-like serine/threonine-protein kinase At4g11900 isoform X2 n=1 Tax=Capsella rubella TaxID=81985 RepID=UPI000CD53A77|nr:G-type lectin S-receptor-like serine/threonine-protein kinase At4g11900 isoform X2 [Capsella rubella]